ncbi:MAG: DUF2179 domain-containing protein [Phycisphaerales bacterium]|nr:DUF2179 domain-containing protein [Phycisphaerales bacterium]
MPTSVIVACLFIILARIADVTLGTLRTVAVINGRRSVAWGLGFFEVLVWLVAASQVIGTIDRDHWYYAIAYALGFATGNFVGMTIEQHLARGEQMVRIFSRRGPEMAALIRGEGHGVTEIDGRGKDGPVTMLFISARRKEVRGLLLRARELDPTCFYLVDDVRIKSLQVGGESGRGK